MPTTTISFSSYLYFKQTNISGIDILYSYNNAQWTTITASNFPINLIYTGNTTGLVYLTTDISFNNASSNGPDSNAYFIIGSNNITINGLSNNLPININLLNIQNYYGLFKNGINSTVTNGYSNITIKYINLNSLNSILKNETYSNASNVITYGTTLGHGWFCQNFYGANARQNYLTNLTCNASVTSSYTSGILGAYCGVSGEIFIENCKTTNDITGSLCSGIVGQYSGSCNGFISIKNSFVTGNIDGLDACGIVGNYCASNYGYAKIENCYSTGRIYDNGSGIIGANAGDYYGRLDISGCYSLGDMTTVTLTNSNGNTRCAGILGENAGSNYGKITISYCYSTGNLSTNNAGGIVGKHAGLNNGYILIYNCYSTGTIGRIITRDNRLVTFSSCGGICGPNAGINGGQVIIINCYSIGNIIDGTGSGGITGAAFGRNTNKLCAVINCYSVGSLNGAAAGGIVGGFAGQVVYITDGYDSNILIQNCYNTSSKMSTGCGFICGETISTYARKTGIITIKNCYSVNNPLIGINMLNNIIVNVFNSATSSGDWTIINGNSNTWNNTIAFNALFGMDDIWYQTTSLNKPFILNIKTFSSNFLINLIKMGIEEDLLLLLGYSISDIVTNMLLYNRNDYIEYVKTNKTIDQIKVIPQLQNEYIYFLSIKTV